MADYLIGSGGNDSLIGGSGSDTLRGGSGNDTIDGGNSGTYTDILDLSDATGDLSFVFSTGTNVIVADTGIDGIGTDTYSYFEGVISGSGNDSITGSAAADYIGGGAGNDSINGFVGNDTVDGGAGIDWLLLSGISATLNTATDSQVSNIEYIDASSASSAVTINLSSQGDGFTITASSGNDTLTGSTGDDLILGSSGDDTIVGGSGSDTIRGGVGNDTLNGVTLGGTDIDFLDLSDAATSITMTFAQTSTYTTISAQGIGTDWYANMEGVITGNSNDTITGSSSADYLIGGGGDDSLIGGSGSDTLRGGAGNDTIDGGNSGTFTDILDLSDAQSGITMTLAQTTSFNTVSANGIGTDWYANIEGVIGGSLADYLTGSSNNDVLRGGAGADTLTGGSGADILTGGPGIDYFVVTPMGGPVANSNTTTAVAGMFDAGSSDFLTFGNGVDIITDFAIGVDKLDTSAMQLVNPVKTIDPATNKQGPLPTSNIYYVYGTFDTSTSKFTSASSNTVASGNTWSQAYNDILLVQGAGSSGATDWDLYQGYIILLDVTQGLPDIV